MLRYKQINNNYIEGINNNNNDDDDDDDNIRQKN